MLIRKLKQRKDAPLNECMYDLVCYFDVEGAQLEYTELVFSSSDYLASISGVPEFQLTIWLVASNLYLIRSEFGFLCSA